MLRDDFDFRVEAVQDPGGIESALTAANDQDLLAAKAAEVAVIRGMCRVGGREAREFRRHPRKRRKARGDDNAAGCYRLAAREREPERVPVFREPGHLLAVQIGNHLALKPVAVIHEVLQGDRLVEPRAGFRFEVIEGVFRAGIGYMGGGPVGAKKHAGGHVIPPETHGFTEDTDRYPFVP